MKPNIWLVICTLILQAQLAIAELPKNLTTKIEDLVNKNFPNTSIGIVIQNAKTGEFLYDKRANELFTPASTIKLFTTAAALYKLTPSFRFTTEIKYYKNKLHNGILDGSLVIKFSGDPTLTQQHLNDLFNKVHKAGIHTIKGNLVIDDSYFQGPEFGYNWGWGNTKWHYAAPISTIIINGNKTTIKLTPSNKLGGLATATVAEESKSLCKVKSTVKTVTWQESESICQLKIDTDDSNNIALSGCWPIGEKIMDLRLAIRNPKKLAYDVLHNILLKKQIKLHGDITYARSPMDMDILIKHLSPPLSDLIKTILTDSNNVYAEALTKTMGATLFEEGSFQTGVLAIKNILQKPTGINFNTMNITDGSGLSRDNLVTPYHLARLLYVMYNEPKLSNIYLRSLSLAGIHGSLKDRCASFDTYQNIKAKTGTLNGVSALAGYLITRNNKVLILTFLINNNLIPNDTVKKVEDELCQLLINQI